MLLETIPFEKCRMKLLLCNKRCKDISKFKDTWKLDCENLTFSVIL